jgi:hypothetical protein
MRPRSISFDRQPIVVGGGANAMTLHQRPIVSHTKGNQDPHVCGPGEERQASKGAEYDVSEGITAWHARDCGTIMGGRHLVEVP